MHLAVYRCFGPEIQDSNLTSLYGESCHCAYLIIQQVGSQLAKDRMASQNKQTKKKMEKKDHFKAKANALISNNGYDRTIYISEKDLVLQ